MPFLKDVRIEQVKTPEEIAETAALAREIWREHYASLITGGQIEYMLEKFQSETAIAKAIAEEGYDYGILRADGEAAGYFAVRPEGNSLFLSKLYLRREYRGKKLSRTILCHLRRRCLAEGLPSIWLTVNKGNAGSLAAYRRLGFYIEREQVSPIGGGFVMDDYVMRCPVGE